MNGIVSTFDYNAVKSNMANGEGELKVSNNIKPLLPTMELGLFYNMHWS